MAEDPAAGLRRRRLGTVRARTTGRRPTTSRRRCREKLHELQRLFLIEAVKYNVLPLDDRRPERFNSDLAGRPELIKGNSQLLFAGMGRLTENVVLNLKNKSHAVTAEVVFACREDGAPGGANGMIIAQGGAFGGWSLYTRDGRLKYCYNLLGINRYYVAIRFGAAGGQTPGAHGVHLRRRRAGQRWERHALPRTGARLGKAVSAQPNR